MSELASPRVDRAVLLALAERCEREEPSWQLDDAIAQGALGLPPCGTAGPQPYTRSRDAAASLMPEGLTVNVITGGKQGKMTYVEVFISEDVHWCDSQADTEPRARAAAALRAMAEA